MKLTKIPNNNMPDRAASNQQCNVQTSGEFETARETESKIVQALTRSMQGNPSPAQSHLQALTNEL